MLRVALIVLSDLNPFRSPESALDLPLTGGLEVEERQRHRSDEVRLHRVSAWLLMFAAVAVLAFARGLASFRAGGVAWGAMGTTGLWLAAGGVGAGVALRLVAYDERVRHVAMLLCALSMIWFPVGTIMGLRCIYYLRSEGVRFVLTEKYRSVRAATPQLDLGWKAVLRPILIMVLGFLLLIFVFWAIWQIVTANPPPG